MIARSPIEPDVIASFLVASELQLDPDAAEALAVRMWIIELDRGEFLCHQGEPSNRLFVLFSGELAVQTVSAEGRELVFTSLKPGVPIGEVSVFDGEPRSAAIRALRRSRVLAIGRETFLDLLHAHPSLSVGIARYLAANVRRLSGTVQGVSFLPLRTRLAGLLLTMAIDAGSAGPPGRPGTRKEVVATQQELADRLGSSRESVNKLLASWADQGVITRRRGRVEIHQAVALSEEARSV